MAIQPKDINKGFYRGDDVDGDGIYKVYYATSVCHESNRVGFKEGLSSCTFEAAVRDHQEYQYCTVDEFAAMVQHELAEPAVKWHRTGA